MNVHSVKNKAVALVKFSVLDISFLFHFSPLTFNSKMYINLTIMYIFASGLPFRGERGRSMQCCQFSLLQPICSVYVLLKFTTIEPRKTNKQTNMRKVFLKQKIIFRSNRCVYVTYKFHNPRNSLGSLCIVNSSKETKGRRTCFEFMTYHLLLVFKPIRSLLRLKIIVLRREVESDCRISRIRANFTFKR